MKKRDKSKNITGVEFSSRIKDKKHSLRSVENDNLLKERIHKTNQREKEREEKNRKEELKKDSNNKIRSIKYELTPLWGQAGIAYFIGRFSFARILLFRPTFKIVKNFELVCDFSHKETFFGERLRYRVKVNGDRFDISKELLKDVLLLTDEREKTWSYSEVEKNISRDSVVDYIKDKYVEAVIYHQKYWPINFMKQGVIAFFLYLIVSSIAL